MQLLGKVRLLNTCAASVSSPECSSLDNDVSDSPSRSAGLSPEHHLQSIVWVKQAQLDACGGKDSTQEPTVGKKACMAHCLAKTKPQPGWTPDTLVSLGEWCKDGANKD